MKNMRSVCFGLILFLSVFCINSFLCAESPGDAAVIKIIPALLVPTVTGDKEKFEEDHWMSRNTSGGIESMSLSKQLSHQDSLEFEGRAIAGNSDYLADLNLSREGVGSLILSFKQFRKYYDGTGGFYSPLVATAAAPKTYGELESDLHLDIGNLKVEGILAKEGAPEYVLEYEREYKEGKKSLVSWGEVNAPSGIDPKIYPTFIAIHETVDKLKAEVKRQTKDSQASAQQSWERARSETAKINSQTFNLNNGTFSSIRSKFENLDSDLYTTLLRYVKDLNKNCIFSFALLYNRFNGGSIEQITDTSTSAFNENHPPNPADVEQDAVTAFPNLSFSPFKDMQAGLGLKAEYINKNASSKYDRDYRTTAANFTPDGVADELVDIDNRTIQRKLTESIRLKYSGIKKAVFYAEGEFEKRFITQHERQDAYGPNPAVGATFERDTDTLTNKNNFTIGCNWYPLSKVNVTVDFKNKNTFIDNKHEFLAGDVTGGLRGFIDTLTLDTYRPSLKLKYKPFRWVGYNLGYAFDKTIYGIRTRAGDSTERNDYIANTYSGEVTLTPFDYFYLSLFYQKRNAVTMTRANGAGGSAVQQPNYKADSDVVRLTYGYAVTKKTTIDGGYSLYDTENFDDFSALGLPLGLDNTYHDIFIGVKHALTKDRSLEVKYNYQTYDEDSNNHIDDYEAHLLYAALNMRF